MGFDAFIAANPAVQPVRCVACQLPEREEIDGIYNSGNHAIKELHRYLVEGCGRTVTRSILDNHFHRGHQLKPTVKKRGK